MYGRHAEKVLGIRACVTPGAKFRMGTLSTRRSWRRRYFIIHNYMVLRTWPFKARLQGEGRRRGIDVVREVV